MAIQRLKLNVKYGMSGHKRAYRIHKIKPEAATVRWFEDTPRSTQYTIEWWCTRPSDRHPLRLFKKIPEGEALCHLCTQREEWFGWVQAQQQVRRENMINGPRYSQDTQAPF